jgi:hypothetical protein
MIMMRKMKILKVEMKLGFDLNVQKKNVKFSNN